MPLPLLPAAPSRGDATNFAALADAFLAALPAWGDAANALEQSLQLVATTGTSTTSVAIGTGAKAFTTQAGKAWVVGSYVYLVSAASLNNRMVGQVTAYDSSTGALAVNVSGSAGAGTLSAWIIGLATSTATASEISVVDSLNLFVASTVETVLAEIGTLINALPWGNLTGKPTTLAGYGVSLGDAMFAAAGVALGYTTAAAALTAAKAVDVGGPSQSWQVVTGSRAGGATYTNSTGRPIQVVININTASTSGTSVFYVNGSAIQTPTWNGIASGNLPITYSVIVPDGATYRCDLGSSTVGAWSELR